MWAHLSIAVSFICPSSINYPFFLNSFFVSCLIPIKDLNPVTCLKATWFRLCTSSMIYVHVSSLTKSFWWQLYPCVSWFVCQLNSSIFVFVSVGRGCWIGFLTTFFFHFPNVKATSHAGCFYCSKCIFSVVVGHCTVFRTQWQKYTFASMPWARELPCWSTGARC